MRFKKPSTDGHPVTLNGHLGPAPDRPGAANQLSGEKPPELRLSFSVDKQARAELEEDLFDKRTLFTDKTPERASTAQVVADYRSQEAVEGDFRQDPKVVSSTRSDRAVLDAVRAVAPGIVADHRPATTGRSTSALVVAQWIVVIALVVASFARRADDPFRGRANHAVRRAPLLASSVLPGLGDSDRRRPVLMRRGEVRLVNLDPIRGSEADKQQPVISGQFPQALPSSTAS